MTEPKDLLPYLLAFYHAFFRNFNAGMQSGLSASQAIELAWEQTLALHSLTDAEQVRMRALIELR